MFWKAVAMKYFDSFVVLWMQLPLMMLMDGREDACADGIYYDYDK